jgi:hypothetical protein
MNELPLMKKKKKNNTLPSSKEYNTIITIKTYCALQENINLLPSVVSTCEPE